MVGFAAAFVLDAVFSGGRTHAPKHAYASSR
jgi:hypothetical protein